MSEVQVNPTTGQRRVKNHEGKWVVAPAGDLQSFGIAAFEAAKDNILLPVLPLDLVGSFLTELGNESVGPVLQRTAQGLRESRRRIQDPLAEAGRLADPISSFGGSALGALLPGNLPVQVAAGGLIEGGRSDNPTESAIGLGLGAGVTFAGDALFSAAFRALSKRRQRRAGAAQEARVEDVELLEAEGFDLPERATAAEGASAPQIRDRLRQLLDPGASVRDKRYALNSIITEYIMPGTGINAFTGKWRDGLAIKVRNLYNQVQSMLPDKVELSELADQTALETLALIEDLPPGRREDVAFYANRVVDRYTAGTLTPKWWQANRSNIASAARSAQDNVEAKALYQVRAHLDRLVMGSDDAVRGVLQEANELWQFKEILNSPGVISSERHLNPTAFIRNLEGMFGQLYETANQSPEVAKAMYQIVDAARQFPEFKTSGTAELLTAGSIARQLDARVQLATRGGAGSVVGGAVGRAGAKVLEPLQQAGAAVLDPLLRAFSFDGKSNGGAIDEQLASNIAAIARRRDE